MVLTLHNKQKPALKRILTTLTQCAGLKEIVLSWSMLPVFCVGLVASSDASYESGESLTKFIWLLPMARLFFEDPSTETRGQVTIHSLPKAFYSAGNISCQLWIDTKSDALLVFNIESSVIPAVPLDGDPLLPDKEASDNFFILEPAKEIIKTLSEQKLRADDIKKKAEQYFQWSWQWKWPKHSPLQIRWKCNDEEESPDYCSVYFDPHNEAQKDHEDDDLLFPFEVDTAEESQIQVDGLHDLPGQIPEIIFNNTIFCRFPDIGCYPIPANPYIPRYSSPSENSGDEEAEGEEAEGEEAEGEEAEGEEAEGEEAEGAEPEGGESSSDESFNNTPQRFGPCDRHLLCTGKQCMFNVVVAPADSTEPNMEPPAKRGKISSTDKPQYELCDSTASQCTNRQAASHEFTCSKCNPPRNLGSALSLSSHNSKYHTGIKICQTCRIALIHAKALSDHKRKEHTGEQICPDCKKPLPNARALSDHKKKEHSEEQICPICEKKLSDKKAFSNHKSAYHSGEKTCPDCNKPLPHAQALYYHRRKEHSREKICPICNEKLPNAIALSCHKSKCHTEGQPCPDCKKPLPSKKALLIHKRKEHAGKQTRPDSLSTLPNVSAHSDHKKAHHKRQHNDVDQSD